MADKVIDVIDIGGGLTAEVVDNKPEANGKPAKKVKAKKKGKGGKGKPTAAVKPAGGSLKKLFPVTKEETRGGGTRNVIAGFSQAQFLRGCGGLGLRAAAVRSKVLTPLGLGDVSMNSIVSMVSGGKKVKAGEPSHHPGELAKFTKDQAAALRAACKPAEAK